MVIIQEMLLFQVLLPIMKQIIVLLLLVIGSTALRKISIGSKISEIGYSAFYRCEMLDTIECLSSVLPTMGIDAFTYVNKSIPVFVHCEVL